MHAADDQGTMPVPPGTVISVIVDLRPRANPQSGVRAHADIEIKCGSLGSINILGFSIYHVKGKPPVVLPPAQKGERRSFPHVKLKGKVREVVESEILREYNSAVEEPS